MHNTVESLVQLNVHFKMVNSMLYGFYLNLKKSLKKIQNILLNLKDEHNPKWPEYGLLRGKHGTFTKTDHMLDHKASPL